MATRRPKAGAPSLFALAEKQIVSLYDAGVLSPAVLQHVIAAYADSGIDWSEAPTLQTVDKHSAQEAVVLIMMPGRALRAAQKDFMSVIEHLGGARQKALATANEERQDDDASLLAQLGGGNGKRNTTARKGAPRKKSAGFNPLVGARAVEKG
jgi:hypothetical protein